MLRIIQTTLLLALLTAAAPGAWAGYFVDPIEFVEPAGWAVGAAGSTYQLWDDFPTGTTFSPDVAQSSPALGSHASLELGSPGFTAGEGRTYSYVSDYSLTASVPNHNTGAPDDGTHVVIQIASLQNPDLGSVLTDSVQILDGNGVVIADGGENSDVLRGDFFNVFTGINTPFGLADFENVIFEFYLPGYVGDFQVRWTQVVHTGFDALRINSMIAAAPFAITPVPEPASLAVFGAALLAMKRRRSR